jgi:hypothetical protein
MTAKNDDRYVKIAVLDNLIEAQLIDSILNEREIPHRIQSYHDTAYNGLFQFQKGWGLITAPNIFAAEIQEILESLKHDMDKQH